MIKVEINSKEIVFENREEFDSYLKTNKMFLDEDQNICIQEGMGVVPSILDIWFSERMEFKKLAEQFKNAGDKEKEAFYDRRQKRQKIFLNSV